MVTLDVESINGRFITLVSTLFTGLTVKTMPSLRVCCVCTLRMSCVCTLRMIA